MDQNFYDTSIRDITAMRAETIAAIITKYPELEQTINWLQNTYQTEMNIEKALTKENARQEKIKLLTDHLNDCKQCKALEEKYHLEQRKILGF